MNYKEHHAGRKMSTLYTTKKKCRLFCLHGQKKRQSANSPGYAYQRTISQAQRPNTPTRGSRGYAASIQVILEQTLEYFTGETDVGLYCTDWEFGAHCNLDIFVPLNKKAHHPARVTWEGVNKPVYIADIHGCVAGAGTEIFVHEWLVVIGIKREPANGELLFIVLESIEEYAIHDASRPAVERTTRSRLIFVGIKQDFQDCVLHQVIGLTPVPCEATRVFMETFTRFEQ